MKDIVRSLLNFYELNYHTILEFAHILFNGPLLIYVSLAKPTNIYIYYLLILIGIGLLYTSINKILNNKGYKWLYIHLFLFAPLILRVGYLGVIKKEIPYYLFSFLQAIGVGAFGHHLTNLLKDITHIHKI